MKKILPLTFFIYLGCSTPQSSVVTYSIAEKNYSEQQVSVQSAIDLAMSAYLKGCADKAKLNGEKGFFDQCVLEARKHVRQNVIFILDQNPNKTSK